MNIEIRSNVFLTTEHPTSHYGIPTLLIDGEAYGPMDIVPMEAFRSQGGRIATAGYWLAWVLNGDDVSDETLQAAQQYLSQWSDEDSRPELVNYSPQNN